MKMTREERYRPYALWSEEEKQKLLSLAQKSPWRTSLHIEAPCGLLNDPNGFSFFNGKWHLFYQYFPFGAEHGLKSWVHLLSDDLVHFEESGLKIEPEKKTESHGVYSGSAMALGDQLFLFYTGNVRDEHWNRETYQLGAFLDKEGKLQKIDKVLIEQPQDVTEHFRDPQIFSFEHQLYTLVGGQSLDKKGIIKLYQVKENDCLQWEVLGNLDFKNDETAYMIECPNLVFVKEKTKENLEERYPVLLYCPQGLSKEIKNYKNIYPNMYKVFENFAPQKASLGEVLDFQNLDEGFDCYATQAFSAPDGRTLAVSWLGLPDLSYPTDRYATQGVLSLVKELYLKEKQLYQYPVKETLALRKSEEIFQEKETADEAYELALTFSKDSITEIKLFADQEKRGLTLKVDMQRGILSVDRSDFEEKFDLEHGEVREVPIENKELQVNVFMDLSVFEIFVNQGEKVLSGRFFPHANQRGIYCTQGSVQGKYYKLEKSNK